MSGLPRPSRVLAVLRRDVAIEFAGKGGRVLPGLTTLLLAPLALAPSPREAEVHVHLPVMGDVPEVVAELDEVVVVERRRRGVTAFRAPPPDVRGPLLVASPAVPDAIRRALDAADPGTPTETFEAPPLELPDRSLFIALVASSILTGALSQSLPGERSQRTLEPLLTASITRTELVLGKWLAWGGYGAASALVASLVAVSFGRQPIGWWILATPWVSLGLVAFGFWMVRRARDVVGGATMAIRTLPATLAFLGLASWWVGQTRPYAAAAIPIGGALMASGSSWDGAPGPALLSVASTLLASLFFLAATARDLDPDPASPGDTGLVPALGAAAVAAGVWWTGVLGGLIWAIGGSPRTSVIPAADGVTAASLGLLALAGTRLARTPEPGTASGLARAPVTGWLAAPLVAGLLWATSHGGVAPLVHGELWDAAVTRLAFASNPGWVGPLGAGVALVAQELLFRGWMRRRAGDVPTVVLHTLVLSPLDPAAGLVAALSLGGLARLSRGSILPGLLARGLAAALPLAA